MIALCKKVILQAATTVPLSKPGSFSQPPSNTRHPSLSPGPASPLSPTARGEGDIIISNLSTTPSSRTDRIQIPDHWREETQDCIDEKVLDDSSRSDIVRTLVTLLVAKHGPKPGRAWCEDLGRQLLLKYSLIKDDLGSG